MCYCIRNVSDSEHLLCDAVHPGCMAGKFLLLSRGIQHDE